MTCVSSLLTHLPPHQHFTYSNNVVQIHGLVAMNLNLDATSEYIDERFPL